MSPRRQRLVPMEQFRLYASSTREPVKLRSEVELEKVQPGVYDANWGTHLVRVLVVSEMPEAPQNAVWEMFSNVAARVVAGAQKYRLHTDDMSTVMNGLLNRYKAEGVVMPYTWEDFRRNYAREHLRQLTPEERTEGLSPEELLRGRSAAEVLRSLPPEERLRGLPPEELLPRFTASGTAAWIAARRAAGGFTARGAAAWFVGGGDSGLFSRIGDSERPEA